MGCTASKLDNEDSVRRCKERRRLMKAAVHARHHLAAAHADYCRSLRLTGSALSTFAAGEPLSVSDHTPAVLLRTHSTAPITATATVKPTPFPSYHSTPTPPQPPPPRSPSVASSTAPSRTSSLNHHQRRPKPTIKLPHILSESSETSSPPRRNPRPDRHTYNAQATYESTPSQASSVWNWENFYPPPSPPDSEYFNNRRNDFHETSSVHSSQTSIYSGERNRRETNQDKGSIYSGHKEHNRNHGETNHDKGSVYSNYSQQTHQHHKYDGDGDDDDEGETEEREEVHCSEWGDHYSTTSSTSDDEEIDRDSRSELESRSNFGSSVHNESVAPPPPAFAFAPAPAPKSKFPTEKSDDGGSSSASWKTRQYDDNSDMRMVVRHRDLVEIVASIQEYFDKAAAAGEQVSEMLETGRAQLDRSFRQLKKTVYHSSGVLSNLSSSWTSKPPLAVKYRFEPGSIDEPAGPKSLCSTLERLLAWEKKLHQEVKAREGVKIEHERKLSSLQSLEYKGGDASKLDKTKAAITRLQSLIIVTSQAVSTTSTAIVGLRDSELVPQLIELCHGFMYMWRSMNQFHEVQNDVVQQVRGLVNGSTKGGDSTTTDLHRQATSDLDAAVSAWHSGFVRVVRFHRDFVAALHGWFKLTLLHPAAAVEPPSPESAAAQFLDEWKLALDRVPDTVASEAVKSFVNVVRSISGKQAEEMKVKKRSESASRELERKAAALRSIEKKYYQSYSAVGLGLDHHGGGGGLDARDPLAEKKAELAACRRR